MSGGCDSPRHRDVERGTIAKRLRPADAGAAAGVAGPLPMPGSLLSPMMSKMEITSDVYEEVMSSVDRQLIERALATSEGRIREAARRLGMARNTLKAKIQKYNISARD